MCDPGSDVEQVLDLDLIEFDKRKYEFTKRYVIVGAYYARLGVLVKPLVVRFIEAPEPIHGAEVYPKDFKSVAKGTVELLERTAGQISLEAGLLADDLGGNESPKRKPRFWVNSLQMVAKTLDCLAYSQIGNELAPATGGLQVPDETVSRY